MTGTLGGLFGLIRDGLAAGRYQAVPPPLPVEAEIGVHGRFRFGVPWPWEAHDTPASLVDATGETVSTPLLTTAWAPRTDGATVTFIVWSEPGPVQVEQVVGTAPTSFANLYRGRVVGVRRLLLGGCRCLVVTVQTPSERIHRLLCEWQDRGLVGEFRCPVADADAYFPHLDTILGTWAWA